MWLIAWITPALTMPLPFGGLLAALLLTLGTAVAVAGGVAFRQARTTVDPTRPDQASTIVTHGIYGRTRNPMYLGFLLALLGWAAYLGNLPACLGLPLFVKYMNRFQIEPEERLLTAKFGDPYTAYLFRVRRWI